MQKSSVGFVYQINDLILVILRSSQTSYFFIIRKKNCMVEIEKDEEECQRIAYTLSSLSPKRENIKMKKSFLKESFRNDLHWISHFQSRKKKKQNKKNPTPEQRSLKEKREECCWIRLFSMLFRYYSSKELKKFKKLWKFCFFVLQLHSVEQFKQKITIKFTRSRDYRGAFCTSVFVVYTIMISPSTMVALVYV